MGEGLEKRKGVKLKGGRAAVGLGRRGLGAILLVFAGVVSYAVFLAVLTTEASEAQTGGSGPPAGTPARGENTTNPNSPPNLITIPAQSCTVSPGASVTLMDDEGDTRAVFTDGQNGIEITATGTQIEVQGPENQFIGNAASSFPDEPDRSFSTRGNYTVVSSTGITCAGGGDTGQDQDTNGVIKRTIPKKRLPPSGGLPVYVMVSSSLLAGVGLLGVGLVIRRGHRR